METIGDYQIIKEIGVGPFARLYLAEHQFIKKQFAIKVLDETFAKDEEFIKRFEKNISDLAKLDHPSIVKIQGISKAGNLYFIIMDPIVDSVGETMNLERYLNLKGRVLSEAELESIAMQIASAFDYAHQLPYEGGYLIHGGLKLSNILVGQSDHGIRVYLSDFGLNHFMGEGKVLLNTYQKMAEALQTPNGLNHYRKNFAFLSPEQKSSVDPTSLDSKADTYAFGVLLYYLMVRSFPEGCFEMPSRLAPEYKLKWDSVITHCLQKDPLKRPVYLVKALEKFLRAKEDDHLYSWKEVEKKVEDSLQMSFTFPKEEQKQVEEKAPAHFAFHPPEDKAHLKPVFKEPVIKRPTYEPDPGAIFQRELQVSRYQPTKVEIKEVEPLLTEMVIIPEGSYQRGSSEGARDEMPRHQIHLTSFALDIHPVTNEQFVRFLMAMGGEKDSNNNDIVRLRDSRIKRSSGKLTIESGYNKHPVVGVTWYGALAYAKWIGKRLPTEAEWEVAAAGGMEVGLYPTGETLERSQANFFSSDTTAVQSYPPNPYGLYDMAGNVYEWCEDWYAYNYYDSSCQEPDNPKGPPQGVYRVLRGGCWKSLKEDLRFSHRHRNNPGTVNGTYGFRCAADVS